MKHMNYYLTMVVLMLCSNFVIQAQDATLTGKIMDEKSGEILPFVNVSTIVGGKTRGAQSDFDGVYNLAVPAGTYTIKVSSIGYRTQEIEQTLAAGETTTLNINLAEEDALLETVVVTGTKFEQRLGEQTVSLEVVKPSLIESNNNTQVDQTIEKVPGVDVVDGQANIRGGSGYSYGAGSRVMLLMDDLPVLTADAGFPNWDFLPVENVEQIEIIKGAASALYGSSAMNGIINVRTAYPKSEPETKASIFGTLYSNPSRDIGEGNKFWWQDSLLLHEVGLSLAHRQKFNQLDVVLGAYLYNTDRWRETGYSRRARVNANFRYRVPTVPGLSVGLNTNVMVNRSGSFLIWNGYGTDSTATGLINNNSNANGLWTATPPINNRGFKLTIDPFIEYFDAERGMKHKLIGRYFKNDNQTDTQQSTNSDFFYGEYQFQKRFSEISLVATAGITTSLGLSDAELYASGGQFKSSNLATYLQLDKKFFDKLNVSLGLRWERNTIGPREEGTIIEGNEVMNESESKPVIRSGINYQAAEYTFLRASYGQAYRFPTIAEKFVRTDLGSTTIDGFPLPLGLQIFPNPFLDSETGWSAELGIKQGFKISNWKGFIDVAAFVNEYSDMMEFTFGASPAIPAALIQVVTDWDDYIGTPIQVPESLADELVVGFQSINIGDTRIWGIDLSVVGQGELFGLPTSVLAGYTYTNPRFKDFDSLQMSLSSVDYNILKYRFPHTVKMDIESKYKNLALGLSVRYFSNMAAIDQAFNIFLPGIKQFRDEHNSGTTIVDARLLYNITPSMQVSFLVKNLFNLDYALRPALIDAPRNFTLKYSINIGKK